MSENLISKPKIKIGENFKVKVQWKVRPIDWSEEAENNLIGKFAAKYGIPKKNVTVEPKFIGKSSAENDDIPYTNEMVENIQNPTYQQTLFKPYLEEREVKDYDYDKIIEIDNIVNSLINFEVYEKGKKYTIKWIKWSNFMSYGPDNFFDLTKMKGLVRLSSNPANQGGKTSFCIDLFRFLLFGKVTSRQDDWTLAKAFNRHIKEATECSVEGCISINGEDYVIKRVLSRPALNKRTKASKVTQKLNYYRIVNGDYMELEDVETLDQANSRNTNKIIKEAIGNERDFDLMICVNSDNLKGLISLKDTERGRLIARWIGLLPLEEKDKVAREYFNKKVTPTLMLNMYNKEDLKSDNNDYEEEIKNLTAENENLRQKAADTTAKIEEYKNNRDVLLQSKRDIDEELTKADVATIEQAISDITQKGLRKAEEKKENERQLSEIGEVEFNEADYKDLIAEDKEVSIKVNKLLNDYDRYKGEIETLKKGEFCPTCGARLKNIDNTEKIKAKEEEMAAILREGKKSRTRLTEIGEKVKELEELRKKYYEKIRLELVIEKNDTDLENYRGKIRENKRILKDIEKNREAIENNNKIDTQLNVIKVNISTEEGILNRIKNEISNNEYTIKSNSEIVTKNKQRIETIEKEEHLVRNWKIYLDIIGKNGISKMVLRNVLPMINGELRRLLADVCDFNVEVAIDDRNDVTFYIDDGEKDGLGSGSGLEQTIASLALRSVLSKISTFSKPSFVVFDEVLGGIADENYDNVKRLYDKISADYAQVFHITHLNQISDWHTANVVVRKENHISKIEAE